MTLPAADLVKAELHLVAAANAYTAMMVRDTLDPTEMTDQDRATRHHLLWMAAIALGKQLTPEHMMAAYLTGARLHATRPTN